MRPIARDVKLSKRSQRAVCPGLLLTVVVLSLGFVSVGVGHPQSQTQSFVEAGRLDSMRWPSFSDYQRALREFYGPDGYAPAWVKGNRPSPQALSMVELFRNAWKKGLRPEDYDAPRWEARLQSLKDSKADPSEFDVAMSVSTMRYVSDLRIGRINPRHFGFGLSIEQKKYDLAQFLRERLVNAPDIPAALADIEPPFAAYKRTEEALAHYTELARTDDQEKLPVPEKAIRPGERYTGVGQLSRFLRLVGDLPADIALPQDTDTYDGALVEAVKRFQIRHGLENDGVLGPATVNQVNIPLSQRVTQFELTLERWRWLPSAFSAPPIVVNIPDFRLRALDENNEVALDMRVVVGRAMRTETPVFAEDMKYVVLRPYWNVPPSILRGEIVPAIRRDRNYIAKKNYEVTTNDGKVVTSGEISDDVLAQLSAGKLAVRQKPGPANALGLVKLIFPNENNVYLHSTPAPELFSRSRRDFSHGCIRVEKPAELTAWALRNDPRWSVERVREAMQSGPDNVTVNLARPVPVFIVYGTALAYANGEVHFYDDIYGYDAKLADALAKGYPYP